MPQNAVAIFVPRSWDVLEGGAEGGPGTETVRDFRIVKPPRPFVNRKPSERSASLEQRMDRVESHINGIEERMDAMLAEMRQGFKEIFARLDRIERRLDDLESDK